MSNGIDILLITKTPLSLVYIRERGYELNEKKRMSLILYNSAFFTEPYILLIITAVGTAVMLFPYVRLLNEHSALGYLCFRFMEAVFIAIGVVSILGLLSLSSDYGAGHIANEGMLTAVMVFLAGLLDMFGTIG